MNKLITLQDAKDAVQALIDTRAGRLKTSEDRMKLQYTDIQEITQELEALHRVLNLFRRDWNFEDRSPKQED